MQFIFDTQVKRSRQGSGKKEIRIVSYRIGSVARARLNGQNVVDAVPKTTTL